ncbi:hypothetical protein PRO82_002269 [Candidatus Protochlamydia amoebophila]|nr:hypothetical protein [Candidatus Protochlamydia amoebophila]
MTISNDFNLIEDQLEKVKVQLCLILSKSIFLQTCYFALIASPIYFFLIQSLISLKIL